MASRLLMPIFHCLVQGIMYSLQIMLENHQNHCHETTPCINFQFCKGSFGKMKTSRIMDMVYIFCQLPNGDCKKKETKSKT